MRDSIDDALNSLLGSRGSNYTLDEIRAAQEMRKKSGGNLLENLQKLTGRSMPTPQQVSSDSMDIMRMCEDAGIDLSESPAAVTSQELQSELDEFTKSLKSDYRTTTADPERADDDDAAVKVDLDSFNGLSDDLGRKIFGQDEFLRKLIVAFKRPLVMPPEDGAALNSIYITGPSCTGRHLALKELTALLKERKVLKKSEIRTIDLSLYPTSTEEKLFLQDLYSALQSKSQVIVFENYAGCHPAFLTQIASLVIKGSCQLSARYVMQNGQLVNVSNSLASETVGSLSAAGKYLILISDKSLEKLADCFGAPFINAIGDVCSTSQLEGEPLKKIAQVELEDLKKIALERLGFKVEPGDGFEDYSVTKAEKQAGVAGILGFYSDVLEGLARIRLEEELPKTVTVKLTIEEKTVMAEMDGKKSDLLAMLPGGYSGELEAVKEELDGIVGLKAIKEYILSLEEYYRMQQRRREEGLKAGEVSKHMIFTGSPGTGKTTIARIISRYLKAIGVLSGGQLVEVSRADLVGRYVGHTAPLTNQVIESAIGGVLFIDEAYSLYRGKDDSFGLEAIDTLVKGIEDNRDNLIVILAGYSNEMQEFLTSNSGLKSRFPNIIDFPDYNGEELLAIAKINAKSKGYRIDEGADVSLLAYFNAVQATRAADAGNGRLARNKIEEAILNQSRRLVAEKDADLSLLVAGDFELDDIMG